ncbi:MAG: FtsX-like permease family protein, partial [Anaerolineae bacterium]
PSADAGAIMTAVKNRNIQAGNLQILADLMKLEEGKREYVGTLGTMSVSFLASLVIAAVGTLVHLFAGLTHHRGVYALLRGVGFHLREIIASVLLEYVLIIVIGVTWGVVVGLTATSLYGKYIVLLAPSDNALPPLIAYNDISTTWWLVAAMAVTTLAIVILVSRYLKRQRIFEVLRMG